MAKPEVQTPAATLPANGPLALETYLTTLESEQARLSILEDVLSQMRQQLGAPRKKQSPPSAQEIRALFARYQKTAPVPEASISQLVVEMREE